jgi:hypothetical protein
MTMPFDAEFEKHLHSLMVEAADATREEIERHKRELVYRAQQTHNSAAPPIAYKDAKLYAMEVRVSKTVEKYIEDLYCQAGLEYRESEFLE